MKKNKPAILSMVVSIVFAFAIVWSKTEIDERRPTIESKPTPQKSPKLLEQRVNPLKGAPLKALILPPPPTPPRDYDTGKHPKNFFISPTLVAASKPNNSIVALSQRKSIETLKPQKSEQNAQRLPVRVLRLVQKPNENSDIIKIKTVDRFKPLTPLDVRPLLPPKKKIAVNNTRTKKRDTAEDTKHRNLNTPVSETSLNSGTLRKGRALLRILEHGAGPEIVFVWPENQRARNQLYALLRKCYGMHVAVLAGNKLLYRLVDPAGKAWQPNMDKFSGFSRLAGGKLAEKERRLISRIRRKHGGISGGRPVRLFSRRFDGALLGNLAKFYSNSQEPFHSLSAKYQTTGGKIWMTDIRINGYSVTGKVHLSQYSVCRNGRRKV